MDSILVVSEEPALPETLAAELPGIRVAYARFREAPAQLSGEEYRLIVIDGEGEAQLPAGTGETPMLRLSRPIRLRDLLYTIRERLQGKTASGREELVFSDGLRLSPSERLARADSGAAIALTEKETELLQCLLEAEGKPVPRDMLLKRVWGYSDDIATHTLETHIYRLRGKLRQASEKLDILSSDEGGYMLRG